MVDITAYPAIERYMILSHNGPLSGPTAPNSVTVDPAYKIGTISAVSTITGNFNPTPTRDPLLLTEFTALRDSIDANAFSQVTYQSALPGFFFGAMTFFPKIHYNLTGQGNILLENIAIAFDGYNDPNDQFFITADSITFRNITNVDLTNQAIDSNIFIRTVNGNINFEGTIPPLYGVFFSNNSIVSASTLNLTGRLFSGSDMLLNSQSTGVIVCYAKGTLILTNKGYLPIEDIKVGDKLITKGKIHDNTSLEENDIEKLESVIWTGKFTVGNPDSVSRPICITKDALGENCPFKDLYVSRNHSLLIDNKTVLAKKLVNNTTIYQDLECVSVEYYHLECENHSAIFANGVLTESYLDNNNNKYVFENNVTLSVGILQRTNV